MSKLLIYFLSFLSVSYQHWGHTQSFKIAFVKKNAPFDTFLNKYSSLAKVTSEWTSKQPEILEVEKTGVRKKLSWLKLPMQWMPSCSICIDQFIKRLDDIQGIFLLLNYICYSIPNFNDWNNWIIISMHVHTKNTFSSRLKKQVQNTEWSNDVTNIFSPL